MAAAGAAALVIGSTPAVQGDDFPVRNRFDMPQPTRKAAPKQPRPRFVELPAKEGGRVRAVEERGFSTADWKMRVARGDRDNVRPPDPEKMGTVIPGKVASVGGQQKSYAQARWTRVVEMQRNGQAYWHKDVDMMAHREVNLDVPVEHPYPWKGRADGQQNGWAERAKAFHRKEKQKELDTKNQMLKERVRSMQNKASKQYKQAQRPPTRSQQVPYRPTKPSSEDRLQAFMRARVLASHVPELFGTLGGDPDDIALTPGRAWGVIIPADPPPREAGGVGAVRGEDFSMYALRGALFGRVRGRRRDNTHDRCVILTLTGDLRKLARVHADLFSDLRSEVSALVAVAEERTHILQVVSGDQGRLIHVYVVLIEDDSAAGEQAAEVLQRVLLDKGPADCASFPILWRLKGCEAFSLVREDNSDSQTSERDREKEYASVRDFLMDEIFRNSAFDMDHIVGVCVRFVGHEWNRDEDEGEQAARHAAKVLKAELGADEETAKHFEDVLAPMALLHKELADIQGTARKARKSDEGLLLGKLLAAFDRAEVKYPLRDSELSIGLFRELIRSLPRGTLLNLEGSFLSLAPIAKMGEDVKSLGSRFAQAADDASREECLRAALASLKLKYPELTRRPNALVSRFLRLLEALIGETQMSSEDKGEAVLLAVEVVLDGLGQGLDQADVEGELGGLLERFSLEQEHRETTMAIVRDFFQDLQRKASL